MTLITLPAQSIGVTGGAGPCQTWPTTFSCTLDPAAAPVTGVALTAATEILYALTGRQFGYCGMTVRPCRRSCWDGLWPYTGNWWMWGQWPRPLFYNGTWYNITCGSCGGNGCSCNFIDEAYLPAPVAAVQQVKIDGSVFTAWQLRNERILMRTDGGLWPLCNNLALDDTQVGTWSITLSLGLAVPELGQLAAGELFCQLVKLLTGDSACTLPRPVQQMIRQGVTMNFLDPNEVWANGRLGLYLCDLFIQQVNPHGLMERAKVYDVDRDDSYSILGLQ